ncbi:sigma-70 family RNA polymerase sigma factor [Metabacillus iocasae]|uniref:RNA polymerase sigma-70 factor (ECF subfamily) n=1 Tax=Priestia iocasae TaxID=2291674 RepID=A0ABS2QU87_9BACI|nr:sigma-70 family RNA polymerase sigma factor [Metabacillus iocasae]MBM7702992.1 RNA polymerase sigma-70 factor (ECF subfamily) [Metabacillus iocasae]
MKATERNFIKRLQNEKEDALDYIVDHYLSLVKGITYHVLSPLKNEGVIEECVNDVFLSIWTNARQFKGKNADDFKKWICTITKFKAIDYYRKISNRCEQATDYIEMEGSTSTEDVLVLSENRAELMSLLEQLEPLDQEIFLMKYFLGFKIDEICERLGLTKSTVNNRLYRGKKKLHQKAENLALGGTLA